MEEPQQRARPTKIGDRVHFISGFERPSLRVRRGDCLAAIVVRHTITGSTVYRPGPIDLQVAAAGGWFAVLGVSEGRGDNQWHWPDDDCIL